MSNTAKKSVFETPLLSTKIKSSSVKLFPEAGLGYLLGPILALISNGVINIWLIQYWDNVLMLGIWNPLFETLLPIVSAVFIIIGNLVVGKLMERKPTLAGKARPLILIGLPIIAVALLVLFIVPLPTGVGLVKLPENLGSVPLPDGMSVGSSNAFMVSILVAVGYNLFYAIAWPLYYTSHSALVNLSTRDGAKRGLLSTCIMAAQLGAAGLTGMIGPFLVKLIGLLPTYKFIDAEGATITTNIWKDAQVGAAKAGNVVETLISPKDANGKWTILMIIMIACLVVGCLLEYYFTRERITEENVKNSEKKAGDESTAKKVSMGEQVKICVKDKYWWMIIIFFFLYQFGGQMKNNDLSFYSQAMTGDTVLSGVINTVGAIPTALGMAIVWPIAAKLTKSKTISLGCGLAFLGSLISFIALQPGMSDAAVNTIPVVSFIVKALGTAPAMYISLALLANILDHQEAIHGKRTDGFTMAVYGSIMVCMAGVCNGIIVGIKAVTPVENQKLVHTILGFGVEGVCYLVMGVMFLFMNVEKFTKLDNKAIHADQKAECEVEGKVWVTPEERAKQEEEENARLVEEARVAELKSVCAKKGLNFDEENAKYLAQKAVKDKEAAEKKAADEAKKAAKAKAAEEAFEALPAEKKAEIKAKEDSILAEFNAIRVANGKPEIA